LKARFFKVENSIHGLLEEFLGWLRCVICPAAFLAAQFFHVNFIKLEPESTSI
jgi:hypothetical protein